jgi:hypothetical protein
VPNEPQFEVVRFTDVERVVCATKDVDLPRHQTTMASSSRRFQQDQESGRKVLVLRLSRSASWLRAFDPEIGLWALRLRSWSPEQGREALSIRAGGWAVGPSTRVARSLRLCSGSPEPGRGAQGIRLCRMERDGPSTRFARSLRLRSGSPEPGRGAQGIRLCRMERDGPSTALLAPFDFAQGAPSLVEGLRAFDLDRACHERTFGLPGGKRKVSRRGGSY